MNLEDWLTERLATAARVRQADEQIAKLTADAAGPYIVLRDDGAVYTARHGYQHARSPKCYRYRGAADTRARLTGGVVIPLSTWLSSKESPDDAA